MFTIFNDTMANIKIISASIRDGKKSDRVALYLKNYITANNLAEAEVLDLSKYNFPLFTERFKFLKEVSSELSEFVGKVNHADAVIIVTPEYNGGYPAALKNIIDVLVDEWKHKPVAISTVSSGRLAALKASFRCNLVCGKLALTQCLQCFRYQL